MPVRDDSDFITTDQWRYCLVSILYVIGAPWQCEHVQSVQPFFSHSPFSEQQPLVSGVEEQQLSDSKTTSIGEQQRVIVVRGTRLTAPEAMLCPKRTVKSNTTQIFLIVPSKKQSY